MKTSTPLWRKLLHWKITLPIASVLLTATVLEGTFRFVFVHQDEGRTIAGFVEPDPDLIWRLKPFKTGPLTTNELGLRDTPYNKNADVKILLLGDSVSWAAEVDLELTYPYLLERRLNERDPDRTYEIINSGVPGYSTFQQLRYLQKRGLPLKPDAIILQFCLNDVVERYKVLFEYGGDNLFLGIDTRDRLGGVHGWLVSNSRAYEALARMAVNLGKAKQEYDVSRLMRDDLSSDLEQAWDLVISELDAIYRLAKSKGIPVLFLIAPYRMQLQDPEHTNQPQRRLINFASKRKLEILDLLLDFSMFARYREGKKLFKDANHFSVLGHSFVVSQMIDPVEGFLERNLRIARR